MVSSAIPDTIFAPGGRSPIRLRAVIDLPEPDSPTIPKDSPKAKLNDNPSSTGFDPNATERFLTSSILLGSLCQNQFFLSENLTGFIQTFLIQLS